MNNRIVSSNDFDKIVTCLPVESAKEVLRQIRDNECYIIINRGILWYETLTDEQREELLDWYNEWRDVTDTFVCPKKPKWLK